TRSARKPARRRPGIAAGTTQPAADGLAAKPDAGTQSAAKFHPDTGYGRAAACAALPADLHLQRPECGSGSGTAGLRRLFPAAHRVYAAGWYAEHCPATGP